jgi:hypothetical protein
MSESVFGRVKAGGENRANLTVWLTVKRNPMARLNI